LSRLPTCGPPRRRELILQVAGPSSPNRINEAIALGVPDPGWLYDQLAPHTGELAIAGVGLDCGGAVDSLLAGLAWRLGRLDEAAGRAQAGLALQTRAGSAIWIGRTKDLIGKSPPRRERRLTALA
jgi:hypothetical protein